MFFSWTENLYTLGYYYTIYLPNQANFKQERDFVDIYAGLTATRWDIILNQNLECILKG